MNTEKNIKGYMGQRYPYSTKWMKNIMVIVQIYGARSVFLLFCDHQDTESESHEMEYGVALPIFTQKNIKGSIG